MLCNRSCPSEHRYGRQVLKRTVMKIFTSNVCVIKTLFSRSCQIQGCYTTAKNKTLEVNEVRVTPIPLVPFICYRIYNICFLRALQTFFFTWVDPVQSRVLLYNKYHIHSQFMFIFHCNLWTKAILISAAIIEGIVSWSSNHRV